MEGKVEDNLVNLTHLITGFSVCAFTLGILYQLVYYAFFDFNVFEYTELNEIITHIIKDGVMIVIPYAVLLLIGVSFETKTIKKSNTGHSDKTKRNFKIGYRIALFLLIAYILYTFIKNEISFAYLCFYILTFFLTHILALPKIIRQKVPEPFGIKIDSYSYLYIFALILSIYGALTHSLIKVDYVKYKFGTIGTYIVVDKDTIKSDSSYYYIGKTNKYFFFFDKKQSKVDIYPERDVKKISLK